MIGSRALAAARPRQHEHHDLGHFARLEQAAGLLGLLQLLCRPSASSEVMTGPCEVEPTRTPCLKTWRSTVWTKQLIAHFDDALS